MRYGLLIPTFVTLSVATAWSASALSVSVGDLRIVEGDFGTRSADVTVMLSQAASAPVMVDYTTRDGTATAGSDYQATSGTLAFAPGDRTKIISIPVIGDKVVERDEMLDLLLSNSTGATLGTGKGTVTIVNDDSLDLTVYEVRFAFTGPGGSLAGMEGCPARSQSSCSLVGLLVGNENVSSDDDVEYEGILQLAVDIDLCESTGEGDTSKLCCITVIGGGPVTTKLAAYADSRGGYLQTESAPTGGTLAVAFGSCPAAMINEDHDIFPKSGRANPFLGELPLHNPPFRKGETFTNEFVTLEILRVVADGHRHP